MRYQSTGEVREPRADEKFLTWPLSERDEFRHVVTCGPHTVTLGPRIIMEPIPTPEQLHDWMIEALVAWRPLDRLVESGDRVPSWTPHVEARKALRRAVDAYLEAVP